MNDQELLVLYAQLSVFSLVGRGGGFEDGALKRAADVLRIEIAKHFDNKDVSCCHGPCCCDGDHYCSCGCGDESETEEEFNARIASEEYKWMDDYDA